MPALPHNSVFPSWQLVILFGREGNQEANMGALLRMITTTTLSRASADLWNHTDAVHGCLALLGATFKKTPHLLTSHPNHLAPLFHLGKVSLPVFQMRAATSLTVLYALEQSAFTLIIQSVIAFIIDMIRSYCAPFSPCALSPCRY